MQTRFIITCAARTGSTMLRYLLDDHPEICCHGEVFIRQGILRFIFKNRRSFGLSPGYLDYQPRYKSKTIENFLSHDLLSTANKNQKAVGFKFKTDEFFDSGYTEITDYLRDNKNIKVIHLRRRNLIAQYISYQFVKKKINPTVSFEESDTRSSRKLTLNKKQLFNYLHDVTQREESIESELAKHQIHRVWYEDLNNNKERYLGDILDFLEVKKLILPATTKKLIVNYENHITNLKEVYLWLSESEFAHRSKVNS